ncbi:carboxymuconolactone decarboxylase family protein [Bacillus sp. FJAT-42376]|uniref:carboxymuconolactone decarboxylase family protein n=1 Tax=Bacillus sp. FJAT-42376 TaxID=2014076 RepID=UPI000F4DBE65|nr:carboxymuconolactone decarboxylase family protein [Bacillus sp. FJAT-42376]AZB41582.1 carboxymuconolactone decarboxylase family protein [Bacillus sp. FJAT-42376]
MTTIHFAAHGDTPFQKLLGHNQDIMIQWTKLGEVLETDGALSAELKEQVRRTLAQGNGCEYCKAKGKPDPALFDEKTSLAAGFAEVFLKHKGFVPTAVFDVVKEVFTDREISELCAFISFSTASQYFGAMMALKPAE